METVVNKDKQPPITKADWAPLEAMLDTAKFRRVGNFGVRNDWESYSQLLAQWASGNWWKGAFHEFAPAYAVFELYKDGSSSRQMLEYAK